MSTYSVACGKVSTGALGSAAAKSLILLNPVTDAFRICEIWLSCGANAAQTDIAAELYRVTTVGSAAGTTGTVRADDPAQAAATTTALTALTTEPTTVTTLREMYFPVNQGLVIIPFPLGREPIAAAAGSRVGLRIVNDEGSSMTAVNVRSTIVFDE